MSQTLSTISELRTSLLEQLKAVASQTMSPAAANSCANLAGKVLATVKLELDFSKLSGNVPQIDFFGEEPNQALLKLEAPQKPVINVSHMPEQKVLSKPKTTDEKNDEWPVKVKVKKKKQIMMEVDDEEEDNSDDAA